MNEKLIIIDEMKPEMKLEQVLDLTPNKRMDEIIGDNLPESVTDYYHQAIKARDNRRQNKLTDTVLMNKLEIFLKSIDTSGFSDKEETLHKAIIGKYKCVSEAPFWAKK